MNAMHLVTMDVRRHFLRFLLAACLLSGCSLFVVAPRSAAAAGEQTFHAPGGSGFSVREVWTDREGGHARLAEARKAARVRFETLARERGLAAAEVLTVAATLPDYGKPWGEGPTHFHATIFDRSSARTYEAVLEAASGALVDWELNAVQPAPDDAEFARAAEKLAADDLFGPLLRAGDYTVATVMPPTDETPAAPRQIHLGLLPADGGALPSIVVAYDYRTDSIVSFPDGAPDRAKASGLGGTTSDTARRGEICGPAPNSTCSIDSGGSGILSVEWPAGDPLWTFDVVRPSITDNTLVEGTRVARLGTGVELRNVRFAGRLVFVSAHMPVLNVQYDADICGPYRDWLFQETCFDVFEPENFTIAPGFHRATEPSRTICESGTDVGDFAGVSIVDGETSIRLISEMPAGQYRYSTGWELTRLGTVQPLFFVETTRTSCTCISRTHHGWWRFDVAIDGTADEEVEGGIRAPNVVERRDSPTGAWTRVTQEMTTNRGAAFTGGEAEFRLRNVETGTTWEIAQETIATGTAEGDDYAQWDVGLLAWDPLEVTDWHSRNSSSGFPPSAQTFINVEPYKDGESIDEKRIAFWYGFHQRVNVVEGVGNTCELQGMFMRRSVVQPTQAMSGVMVGRPLQ
jgi:hypothetical protein